MGPRLRRDGRDAGPFIQMACEWVRSHRYSRSMVKDSRGPHGGRAHCSRRRCLLGVTEGSGRSIALVAPDRSLAVLGRALIAGKRWDAVFPEIALALLAVRRRIEEPR